jgi:lipopolysaccharide transport system ATP-binding protein
MSGTVIKVENVSKKYRLGNIGTGTFYADLNRWFAKVRGKEDPSSKIDPNLIYNTSNSNSNFWALNNVSFEVKKGEVFGVIGKNGAGKSTLLKILSRVTLPTEGFIKAKGRIASLLEVGTGFHPELTGKENVYMNGTLMGMTKAEVSAKFDEIVEFSGIDKYINTPVKRYSTGMYVRLAFSVAAHLEPEILVVDEVLAVGDLEFQEKCLGKMKDVSGRGRTVIFVSHNMAAVKSLCTRAMLLKSGCIQHIGNTQDVVYKYISENTSGSSNGVINETAKRVGTGESKFTYIAIKNSENRETTQLFYREPIKVVFKMNVHCKIPNGIIWLRIYGSDGTELILSESPKEGENLDVGEAIYEVTIPTILLPGEYYLTPSIYWSGNAVIDEVEKATSFKVINATKNAEGSYLWTKSFGYVLGEGKWERKQIEQYKDLKL